MFDLTPGERRGALVLLALVALGAATDLARRESVLTPEPPALVAPAAGPAPTTAPPAPAAAVPPLDLNAATVAELDRLPGIGPVLAARIVSHRGAHGPFRRPEDLLAVQGIGPRLYARLEPLVAVRAAREPAPPPLQSARPRAR